MTNSVATALTANQNTWKKNQSYSLEKTFSFSSNYFSHHSCLVLQSKEFPFLHRMVGGKNLFERDPCRSEYLVNCFPVSTIY